MKYAYLNTACLVGSLLSFAGCNESVDHHVLDTTRLIHYRTSCSESAAKLEKRLQTYQVQHQIEKLLPERGAIPEFNADGVLKVSYPSEKAALAEGAVWTYKMECGPNSALDVQGLSFDFQSLNGAVDASPVARKHNGEYLIQLIDDRPTLFLTKHDFSR